ncbi:transmembrane protein 8B-like isoform X1 [Erpetoichthys calabaricus]|uniref:transmembrane protein 8B-like isoform X1 n=2 Tax=Erpetoichthys calabaricus TaxID=27687 RepID=UPI002234BD77|nr:transmembrane protein 8B-like isoform X1 [Erpetoichthys calabaricus]
MSDYLFCFFRHCRAGALPVIDLKDVSSAEFTSLTQTIVAYNGSRFCCLTLDNPAAEHWFVAAYIPPGNINIKAECSSTPCYNVLPQVRIAKRKHAQILNFNTTLVQSVHAPNTAAYLKLFIPENTKDVTFQVINCVSEAWTTNDCPILLTVGSTTHRPDSVMKQNCLGSSFCVLRLHHPPWNKWVPISLNGLIAYMVSLHILATHTAYTPESQRGLQPMISADRNNMFLWAKSVDSILCPHSPPVIPHQTAVNLPSFFSEPVSRKDTTLLSVRYTLLNGPVVNVFPRLPSMIPFDVNDTLDVGGTLIIDLELSKLSFLNKHALVFTCLCALSPALILEEQNCKTAFYSGHSIQMTSIAPVGKIQVQYPEPGRWYLTMQILCPSNICDCSDTVAKVNVSARIACCSDKCAANGKYGIREEKDYYYGACLWENITAPWLCPDTSNSTYLHDLKAVLLLTISNGIFIPAIILAVRRGHFTESVIYAFTMVFSALYHACDMDRMVRMCVTDRRVLQYGDFLASTLSIWSTLICMARLKYQLRCALLVIGCMSISISLQYNLLGHWSIIIPCIFAFTIMVASWVRRGILRRQCYPVTWKRWVFYLLPGTVMATLALVVFLLLITKENYLYTHTIWHILCGITILFLLPPSPAEKEVQVQQKKYGGEGEITLIFCSNPPCRNLKDFVRK